jgi:hypothetical protein
MGNITGSGLGTGASSNTVQDSLNAFRQTQANSQLMFQLSQQFNAEAIQQQTDRSVSSAISAISNPTAGRLPGFLTNTTTSAVTPDTTTTTPTTLS